MNLLDLALPGFSVSQANGCCIFLDTTSARIASDGPTLVNLERIT